MSASTSGEISKRGTGARTTSTSSSTWSSPSWRTRMRSLRPDGFELRFLLPRGRRGGQGGVHGRFGSHGPVQRAENTPEMRERCSRAAGGDKIHLAVRTRLCQCRSGQLPAGRCRVHDSVPGTAVMRPAAAALMGRHRSDRMRLLASERGCCFSEARARAGAVLSGGRTACAAPGGVVGTCRETTRSDCRR